MICSGISTFFWIMVDHEDMCSTETIFEDWVRQIGNSSDTIVKNYVFYPVFLLSGYLTFVLSRWRAFMINCHTIQGRIHDVALLCGCAVGASPRSEVRKRLFVIYRYLNLIHALCYLNVSPMLEGLDLETDFVDELGLLKDEEAIILMGVGNKIRETVIAWLVAEVSALLLMEGVNRQFVEVDLANGTRGIRAITTKHHDLFVRDNPNLFTGCLVMVVNIFLVLTLSSYPFSLFVHTPRAFPFPCFQPITMLGVFVLLASYQTAYCLIVRLRNPFTWNKDRIKVDSLMASTDRATFALLRATFRSDTPNSVQTKGSCSLQTEVGEARPAARPFSLSQCRLSSRRTSTVSAYLADTPVLVEIPEDLDLIDETHLAVTPVLVEISEDLDVIDETHHSSNY
jgi:hypothetical protein